MMHAHKHTERATFGQAFLAQHSIFVNEKAGGVADTERSFDAGPLLMTWVQR